MDQITLGDMMSETTSSDEKDRLVHECQGLVRHLVQQVRTRTPAWIETDDLISYGQIGLLQAARDFDPDKGVKFSTFAFYRIRGAIFDGVNKLSWFRSVRDPETKYQQMADSLIKTTTSETPMPEQNSKDELSREASWFTQLAGSLAVVYLATVDEQGIPADVVDKTAEAPSSRLEKSETNSQLKAAMEQLPADAGALIRAVYFEDRTLQEAADRLGISKSWASRVHARALEQMARIMRQDDFGSSTA